MDEHMNRISLLIVAIILTDLMTVSIGCVRSSDLGPNPEAVLADAQPPYEIIIDALEQYHRRHGRYPRELTDLVTEGLLAEMPELPIRRGTDPSGTIYEANHALDFYRLGFGYYIEGAWAGDMHWRVFVSDDPEGWQTTGTPSAMMNLVADRLAVNWQGRHDGKTLELFISEVIEEARCSSLSRARVTHWLGEANEIDVPPEGAGDGVKGYVYQARDEVQRRYCFVYKERWLPTPRSYLTADERAKLPGGAGKDDDGSIEKNYPVLAKLFLIEEVDGRPTWTVVRECP